MIPWIRVTTYAVSNPIRFDSYDDESSLLCHTTRVQKEHHKCSLFALWVVSLDCFSFKINNLNNKSAIQAKWWWLKAIEEMILQIESDITPHFCNFPKLRVNYSHISDSKSTLSHISYSHRSSGHSIYLNDSWFLSVKLQRQFFFRLLPVAMCYVQSSKV